MMFSNGDGTFTGGPFDVLLILHDVRMGTYHPAFFTEAPMPGPLPDNPEVIRLRSRMHHTEGAPTLEEAQVLLDELGQKIQVPAENIWREARDWDGNQGLSTVVPNWRKKTA